MNIKHFSSLPCLVLFSTLSLAKSPIEIQHNRLLLKSDDGQELNGTFCKTNKGGLQSYTIISSDSLLIHDRHGDHYFINLRTDEIKETVSGKANQTFFSYKGGYFYETGPYKPATTFYNFDNEKVWTINKQFSMLSPGDNIIVLEERNISDMRKTLFGYDVTTGQELWRYSFTHNNHYPFSHLYADSLVKSNIYIIADSLICLNRKTGEVLTHSFSAGVKEPAKTWFMPAKIVQPNEMPYEWTESYYTSQHLAFHMDRHTLTHTHSNWLANGDSLFIADANNIYCFDHQLREIWCTPLPEGCGSFSNIRMEGEQILMINYGVAFQDCALGRQGKSFTARFDKRTGKQLQLTIIGHTNKIKQGYYVPGRAYWQDDYSLSYTDEGSSEVHRIDNFKLISANPDNAPKFIELTDTISTLQDGHLKCICTDSTQLVVVAGEEEAYAIRSNGKFKLIPPIDVYLLNGNNLYSNDLELSQRHYVIIDPQTRKVRIGFYSPNLVKYDGKNRLYIKDKNGLGIIDLPWDE